MGIGSTKLKAGEDEDAYTFRVTARTTLQIDLTSATLDPFLYLYEGAVAYGTDHKVLNDNGGTRARAPVSAGRSPRRLHYPGDHCQGNQDGRVQPVHHDCHHEVVARMPRCKLAGAPPGQPWGKRSIFWMIEPFTLGPWDYTVLVWHLCGLPVGMPTLAGTLVGTVVRGASAKRGCGVGLLVGIASAPLTLVGEYFINTAILRHDTSPSWLLWQLVTVPAMPFAVLAAYLVWRRAVLPDIRYR